MVEPRSEWVVGKPLPPLRPYVERYCGYRMTGFPAGLHRGVPSRHMTLIVSIGPDIDVVAQTNPVQGPDRYRCVIGGLQASNALIKHDGNQEGVTIELTPLGSRALLGMPAAELWDLSLEFSDVLGSAGRELWERLQPAELGWDQRFGVCDDVLTRRLHPDGTAPELRFSWETLVTSGGQIPVEQLARDTGWSRQHLGSRFRQDAATTTTPTSTATSSNWPAAPRASCWPKIFHLSKTRPPPRRHPLSHEQRHDDLALPLLP